MNKKNKFYALAIGGVRGIYNSWAECKNNIGKGYSKYKAFDTIQEATQFLKDNKVFKGKKNKNQIRCKKIIITDSKETKEVNKTKSFNPVFIPKSNICKESLALKAKLSFEANKLKINKKEMLLQRDLEILRNRNLKQKK